MIQMTTCLKEQRSSESLRAEITLLITLTAISIFQTAFRKFQYNYFHVLTIFNRKLVICH